MSSVYFDPAVGGDGSTITDDSNPSTGLANGGHRTRYVPSLANIVSVGSFSLTQANAAAASAVTASNWAVLTGGPVSGGEYSAKYHAQAASSSATLANSWATQMATPVSGGEYSAKYHATAAASSAAAAASSAGSLVMPTIIAADAGRGLKVNGAGNGWVLDLRVLTVSYDNRADLRSMSPNADDLAMVDGLGLFQYAAGVDEGPDDDETAFATASGYWLLVCPSWDVVDAMTLLDGDEQNARLAESESFAARFLQQTSTQSAFTLAINSSTTFTVTVAGAVVGASVMTTPPTDPTLNTITLYARVTATDTVTVYIGNANSALTGGFGAGDWQITVINK